MRWDIRRLWSLLKNYKIFFIISIIFLYVFVTVYQYGILHSNVEWRQIRIEFFNISQIYLPFVGLLWVSFTMKYLFDDDMEELNRAYDNKSRFRFCIYVLFLYQIVILPIYIWYFVIFWKNGILLEVFRLFLELNFLCIFFYNFIIITRNVLIAFMISLIYTITMIYFVTNNIPFNIYTLGIIAEQIDMFYWLFDIFLIFILYYIKIKLEKIKKNI